jgi:hydrophobe/amphiphile efflux-3 (HAE3) family protein
MQPSVAIAAMIKRYPAQLVAGAMCAALALSFGIPRLEFKTGQETLIDPSSKVARDNERFQREFGGDPVLVLFETPSGGSGIQQLFTDKNRAELAQYDRDLAETGQFESIITPLVILELAATQVEKRIIEEPANLARDQDAAEADARVAATSRGETQAQQDAAGETARQRVFDAWNVEFGADARRFVDVGERSLENPRFVEFVLYDSDGAIRSELTGIFPDDAHALMVLRPNGNLSIDQSSEIAGDVVEGVESYRFDGVDVLVSGPPLLIKEINDKMREALLLMATLAVWIMAGVLFLVFRARWRLLSLPAVLVGCVAAFGLMGFLGIPLTMVTISGLPILIGLGVDFAVQAHSRIEEETQTAGSAEAGIERAVQRLGPALGVAALAACIGFSVMHLSKVPMIRDFGSMLAVGAAIVFITSVALVSSIVFLRERVRIGPTNATRARIEVERMVNGLTARTVGRLLPIAAVAALIALVGLYLGGRIDTQTDPERLVPSDSRVLRDLHRVRDVSGSTNELNLLVELHGEPCEKAAPPCPASLTDDQILDWMYQFEQRQLEAHPELGRSNSLATFTAALTGRPPTASDARAALAAAPQAIVNTVVSQDGRMANMTFALTGNITLDGQKALTEAMLADSHPPTGVSVAPAGISVVGIDAVEALTRNRDLMSFVAIAAIFLLLLAAFRNPVKAIAPLLPVVLALGASAMLLYASGIEYSPLTSISGPLIIAMGTEFNILLMCRYFEERGAGAEPRQAMSIASLRIGRAIMASGLTVMVGHAVLAFSDFPLLDNFGRVNALNIAVSLFSTLVLLPPLLVWADEEHHLVGLSPDALPQ